MTNINFKQFLEEEKSISDLMDRNGMVLFFKKDNSFFGAPEDSRLIFAKLKSGDDDDPMMPGFRDQASFLGIDLLKSLMGSEESIENIFGIKDIPKIKVLDREELIKKLIKTKKSKNSKKD